MKGTSLFMSQFSDFDEISVNGYLKSNVSKIYFKGVGFGLAWLNLTYTRKSFISKKSKTILRNLSGQIKFGEMIAIMGPSGAGKSTLLNCINGRLGSGLSDESKFYVCNSRAIHSCFLVQDQKEHLLMNLTTEEALLYASKIKNRISFRSDVQFIYENRFNDKFDHISNVRKLMADLILNDCADTMISNCSGGQQKRIVIALELVAQNKPNIMCIDEPTSGLDSYGAEQVIECLRTICREHSIGIATTIHQPNADILYMFDSLYVLSKAGYCVYNDRPQNLSASLKYSGVTLKEIQVPIEVLMKLASKTTSSDNTEEFQVDDDIKQLAKSTKIGVKYLRYKCYAFGKESDLKKTTNKFSFAHFWVLLDRAIKCGIIRGWKPLLTLTIYELGTGLLGAYLFGRSGVDDGCVNFDPYQPVRMTSGHIRSMTMTKDEPLTAKNMKLLFFFILIHNLFQLCYTILTFPLEVKLFFNEQHNRWYSTGAYFWSKALLDTLIGVFITILYVTPIYYMTGQRGSLFGQHYNLFLLSNILTVLCTQGMASAVSIIAVRNFNVCQILGTGILQFNNILGGSLIPFRNMDPIVQYISYLSFIRMAFETQVYILYGLNRCDPNQNQWSLVLYQFDFTEEEFYLKLYLLLSWAVFWRFLALVSLLLKTNDWNIISTKRVTTKLSRPVTQV